MLALPYKSAIENALNDIIYFDMFWVGKGWVSMKKAISGSPPMVSVMYVPDLFFQTKLSVLVIQARDMNSMLPIQDVLVKKNLLLLLIDKISDLWNEFIIDRKPQIISIAMTQYNTKWTSTVSFMQMNPNSLLHKNAKVLSAVTRHKLVLKENISLDANESLVKAFQKQKRAKSQVEIAWTSSCNLQIVLCWIYVLTSAKTSENPNCSLFYNLKMLYRSIWYLNDTQHHIF